MAASRKLRLGRLIKCYTIVICQRYSKERIYNQYMIRKQVKLMKYFIFIDKNNFSYSQSKIWKSALNIQTWPKLCKRVISISTHTYKALSTSSKISCHLRLCYYINLNFIVHITSLKSSSYASFEFFGDFTDQGRWISRQRKKVQQKKVSRLKRKR